jgi:hypothetical protein
MQRSSRFTDLSLALLGLMVLWTNLNNPRVEALHGSDIVGLVASASASASALLADWSAEDSKRVIASDR